MMTAQQSVDDFRKRLLRLDVGAEAILPAAAAHPHDSSVQMCAAVLHLYGQTNTDQQAAGRYLEAAVAASGASASVGAGTAAESGAAGEPRVTSGSFFRGLRLWRAQQYDAAAAAMEQATLDNPADLLALKVSECLYYDLGQQHCGPRYRAHADRLAAVHGGDTDFLAMHSFAHELCGDFDQARTLSERALQIEPRNPWAQHTLSHVTIRLGDIGEGESRLRAFLPMAATCSRAIHSHTAWHVALFDVERLDLARALGVFRTDIWGFTPDSIFEQVDGIALLWRIEMAGGSVGNAWEEVARHVESRAGETFMPFLSAHHAYALARAGRTRATAELCQAVERRAAGRDEGARTEATVWARVGVPVVRASIAFAQESWGDAAAELEPIMPDICMVGGSDAQDDLFRQMNIVALARSGHADAAASALERSRAAGKRTTELDRYFAGLA